MVEVVVSPGLVVVLWLVLPDVVVVKNGGKPWLVVVVPSGPWPVVVVVSVPSVVVVLEPNGPCGCVIVSVPVVVVEPKGPCGCVVVSDPVVVVADGWLRVHVVV